MAIPGRVELRRLFLDALRDGVFHTHAEVADYIAAVLDLSQDERKQYAGDGPQTELDNAINWINGKEFQFDFRLIEYDDQGGAFRLTEAGRRVVVSNPSVPLTYSVIREILGET